MKVLIYSHLFPPAIGGMQYSNLEIAQGLHALGHRVRVIACGRRNAQEYISHLDFPVCLLPKWPSLNMYSLVGKSLLNWIFLPCYYLTIKKEIDHFKPDIILVADETSNCFWGCWAKWIKVPYISYCSVPFLSIDEKKNGSNALSEIKYQIKNFKRQVLKRLMRKSYLDAQSLLAVSHSTRNELKGHLPADKNEKIDIIPRSVSHQYFNAEANFSKINSIKNAFGIQERHFVLLSVSNLNPDKGIADVIRALHQFDKNGLEKLRYIIVGGGKDFKNLQELAKELKLNRNIFFTGEVDHAEAIHYYDACDTFILASRRGISESFGRVFVEAASRAKPSIGPNVGGAIDIIENGETGFLVTAGNADEIYKKIVLLKNNSDLVKTMGLNARKQAYTKFTTQSVAQKFDHRIKATVAKHYSSVKSAKGH